MADVFTAIAEDRRAVALATVASVADPASVTGISSTTAGASGASTLRIDAGSGAYLLRLEVGREGFRNPERSYPCLAPRQRPASRRPCTNIANNFSEVPDVDTLVLEGWLGRSPDDDTRHRLALIRDLHRLFYGSLLLCEFIGRRDPEAELTALTPDEFRAAILRGELRGTPELLFVLGKMYLAGFAAAQGS